MVSTEAEVAQLRHEVDELTKIVDWFVSRGVGHNTNVRGESYAEERLVLLGKRGVSNEPLDVYTDV